MSDPAFTQQAINNILILKEFVHATRPIYEALIDAESELLQHIRDLVHPVKIKSTIDLIGAAFNSDVAYAKQPLALRQQREYAVRVCADTRMTITTTRADDRSLVLMDYWMLQERRCQR